MFTKEQLTEALLSFTRNEAKRQYVEDADEQAIELSKYISGMTSICSMGKREVAGLVSLIIGRTVHHHVYTPTYAAFTVRISSDTKPAIIVGKSGESFYSDNGSPVTNSHWIKNTVLADEKSVIEFADKIWNQIVSYDLERSFVKMLNKMITTHNNLTKELK